MNSNIYFKTIIYQDVILQPKHLNNNFEKNLEDQVISKISGKCINEGFVMPGSIKIVGRSIGNCNNYQFNGIIKFKLALACTICNPPKESTIKVKIEKINKHGF